MPFTENESYKHKSAKEVLCKWLQEKRRQKLGWEMVSI